MAAGDRKIKLLNLYIPVPEGGNAVIADLRWELRIENRLGIDVVVHGGTLSLDLGLPAAALALTLSQIRTAALNKLNADATIPPHDAVN